MSDFGYNVQIRTPLECSGLDNNVSEGDFFSCKQNLIANLVRVNVNKTIGTKRVSGRCFTLPGNLYCRINRVFFSDFNKDIILVRPLSRSYGGNKTIKFEGTGLLEDNTLSVFIDGIHHTCVTEPGYKMTCTSD